MELRAADETYQLSSTGTHLLALLHAADFESLSPDNVLSRAAQNAKFGAELDGAEETTAYLLDQLLGEVERQVVDAKNVMQKGRPFRLIEWSRRKHRRQLDIIRGVLDTLEKELDDASDAFRRVVEIHEKMQTIVRLQTGINDRLREWNLEQLNTSEAGYSIPQLAEAALGMDESDLERAVDEGLIQVPRLPPTLTTPEIRSRFHAARRSLPSQEETYSFESPAGSGTRTTRLGRSRHGRPPPAATHATVSRTTRRPPPGARRLAAIRRTPRYRLRTGDAQPTGDRRRDDPARRRTARPDVDSRRRSLGSSTRRIAPEAGPKGPSGSHRRQLGEPSRNRARRTHQLEPLLTVEERVTEIANLLLREGALRPSDPEHRQIQYELTENPELYRKLRERLEAVGYELVDRFHYLGVRIAPETHDAAEMKNREGIHAGHIRVIVYLWVHLVYREWMEMRGELEDSSPPGEDQTSLLDDDEDDAWKPPTMSYDPAQRDFEEIYSERTFKGYMTQFSNWKFVDHDRSDDEIRAASSLYTLVDRRAMEEFVVDNARRTGIEDPAEAVTEVAARGRRLDEDDPADGGDQP